MSTQGSSFPSVSSSQEPPEGCASLISGRKLKVTLLSCEWGSTKGGLSTFNRELAIQLAKKNNVEVSMYLPLCNEEDEREANGYGVHIVKANAKPGYDPIDWLAAVPRDHCMDVVIGHGIDLGRQVPMIKELHPNCKWIQVVHTDPEELGMFKDYADQTAKGEDKNQDEVELCKLADQVVAVGPKLTEGFACYFHSLGNDQDVINLTPGIFSEFANINQAAKGGETFRVLVFGHGDCEDFHLKGYDIAAHAIAKLKDKDRSFELVYVSAPNGEEERVKERFLKEGISPSLLIVRSAKESKQLAEEFCEADLVIMPSRTEGFGLVALEALSAGLPVLVTANSGIGKALKKVPNGSTFVVNSEFNNEDPMKCVEAKNWAEAEKWAEAIKIICRKEREVRLQKAILLRQNYAEKYQWEEQCSTLVERMFQMIKETSVAPNQAANSGEQGSSATQETVQPHILVNEVNSRSENESQDVHHGASGDQQLFLREYGESFVKLFIRTKYLEKETKEVIEEELTKAVQKYLKLNDHSGDNCGQAMKSITDHLINVYKLHFVTAGEPETSFPETSTSKKKTQNTDIHERSLMTETNTAPDQAVAAVNLGEHGPSSISEAAFHPDLTIMQRHIVGDVVSSDTENEMQRKRPLHPIVTTTVKRQRQNACIPERSLMTETTAAPDQAVAAVNSEIQRKRPSHPIVTTTVKRQRRNASIGKGKVSFLVY
ncbi:PREDICTED: D-inositol 3-phosphate glycosyltransferase-like isoform X2 [Acropora digitifera]|uniref:D-inositol 3-phosphate glycosyltransferase-like isoform X2 n=1 Tax=Acropora digitifera TaxID=70779 RepID=UPI00077ADDA5|nr:PREDICTED: D-inositol 3-phosphate glycosyltransferase-like isoform X2 [Acropora digitifera]